MINPFEYPSTPHIRRHAPDGYRDYLRFHPWLRDEFWFRCVFCLHREQWPTTSEFEIDHSIPVSERPDLECCYGNLLYVCRRCNNLKTDCRVPDPGLVAYGSCLRVHADGSITALNSEGHTLIRLLRLDRPKRIRQRRMILELLEILAKNTGNKRQLRDWLGFPVNLDDLRRLRPTSNGRPEGLQESAFVLRERGLLPDLY